MMFEYMIKDNDIPLLEKDKNFIKALIAGEPNRCRYVVYISEIQSPNMHFSPDEKPFLFDIVANKRNGLDVDKFVNSST